MSDTNAPIRRPGVLTFIGVILYIQAGLVAVAAVTMIIWRNDVLTDPPDRLHTLTARYQRGSPAGSAHRRGDGRHQPRRTR